MFSFTDKQLDDLRFVHDARIGGPRYAYAFYLGRKNYMDETKDLETQDVEDFIIAFYSEYNRRFGVTY